MKKSIAIALLFAGLMFFSSNALAGSFNVSVFFGGLYEYYVQPYVNPYYYSYSYPSYYHYNDIYFDPPVYYPTNFYHSNYSFNSYAGRINPPHYPSYYGRSANPTLREIGYQSTLGLPPSSYNPSYYYTGLQECTSTNCYYN